jgi:hypothetical protein
MGAEGAGPSGCLRSLRAIGVFAAADHVRVMSGPCDIGHGRTAHANLHCGQGCTASGAVGQRFAKRECGLSNNAQEVTRPA